MVDMLNGSYKVVRRAAFDIGSGSTKMQCSDFEFNILNGRGKILNTIVGEERPVPFGADYLKSSDGCLSEALQLKGLNTILELKEIAVRHGATQFSGIATEVFRKAVNGDSYLNRIRALDIPVRVLTQDMEAELGYTSVVSGYDESDLCVWDSGGASFQISTRRNLQDSPSHTFDTYMGSLGSSVSAALLVREVLHKSLQETPTPNPVSMEQCQSLIDILVQKLAPVPSWLKDKDHIVAVSGKNSIFKLCCNVLELLRQEDACIPPGRYRQDSLPGASKITVFSYDEALLALKTCTNSTDDELCKYVNFQYSDGPKIIVPKLCLLVAVMKHVGVQHVCTVQCIGSCSGVITTPHFWTHSLSGDTGGSMDT